jgi:hypothetical protein
LFTKGNCRCVTTLESSRFGEDDDVVSTLTRMVRTMCSLVNVRAACLAVVLCSFGKVDGLSRPPTETLFISSHELGFVIRIDLETLASRRLPLDLTSATDLACASDGRIYLSQDGAYGGRRAIISFERDGTNERVEFDFRTAGLTGGPEGLTFGPGGQLFFNTRFSPGPQTGVWKFMPRGDRPTQVLLPFTLFGTGVEFLAHAPFAGHLVAADFAGGRVVRRPPPFESAQTAVDFIIGVNDVNDVAVNSHGNIFLSNPVRGVIRRCGTDGRSCALFSRTLHQVRFIAFDAGGNLYAPTFEGPVLRISPDGVPRPLPGIIVPGGTGVTICPPPRGIGRIRPRLRNAERF